MEKGLKKSKRQMTYILTLINLALLVFLIYNLTKTSEKPQDLKNKVLEEDTAYAFTGLYSDTLEVLARGNYEGYIKNNYFLTKENKPNKKSYDIVKNITTIKETINKHLELENTMLKEEAEETDTTYVPYTINDYVESIEYGEYEREDGNIETIFIFPLQLNTMILTYVWADGKLQDVSLYQNL